MSERIPRPQFKYTYNQPDFTKRSPRRKRPEVVQTVNASNPNFIEHIGGNLPDISSHVASWWSSVKRKIY